MRGTKEAPLHAVRSAKSLFSLGSLAQTVCAGEAVFTNEDA